MPASKRPFIPCPTARRRPLERASLAPGRLLQVALESVAAGSHCPKMGIAPLVEVLVGIAHGLGLAATEHHLEIDRPEAVILIAVNHPGRARDAFPGTKPCGQTLAALILDEHVEEAVQHEEALLHLVSVRGVALPGLHIHDRQGEVICRNDARVSVLAGTAGTDETVLRALV